MSNPNLVKSAYTSRKKNVRIIDNNARAEERIAAFREQQVARASLQDDFSYADAGDEFVEGLNPEQLERLTADPGSFDPNTEAVYDEEGGVLYEDGASDGASGAPPEAPAERPAPAQNIAALTNEKLAQAQEEADQLIAAAREQADELLAGAQQEAETIRQNAQSQGYDAGYAEGRENGKAEVASEMEEEYQTRVRQLDMEYQNLVDKLEPEMVDTLTRIYEHVFDVNLRGEKKIILHLLQTTLSRIEPGDDFIIHVSSADFDRVQDEKERLREYITNPNATLELIEDPLLKENECMVETEGGIFDCSVGEELSELTRKLKLLAFDRRRN